MFSGMLCKEKEDVVEEVHNEAFFKDLGPRSFGIVTDDHFARLEITATESGIETFYCPDSTA
jgi:hypothetical protein